jgi:hypothetical protein
MRRAHLLLIAFFFLCPARPAFSASTFFSEEKGFYRNEMSREIDYMRTCALSYGQAIQLLDDNAQSYVVIQRVNAESAEYAFVKMSLRPKDHRFDYVNCERHSHAVGALQNPIDDLVVKSSGLSGSYVVGRSVLDGPTYFVTIRSGEKTQRFSIYAPYAHWPAITQAKLRLLRQWARTIDDAAPSD